MSKKITAVEWLVEKINSDCTSSIFITPDIVKKALQMERNQIVNAFNTGNEHVIPIEGTFYYKEIYQNDSNKKSI